MKKMTFYNQQLKLNPVNVGSCDTTRNCVLIVSSISNLYFCYLFTIYCMFMHDLYLWTLK